MFQVGDQGFTMSQLALFRHKENPEEPNSYELKHIPDEEPLCDGDVIEVVVRGESCCSDTPAILFFTFIQNSKIPAQIIRPYNMVHITSQLIRPTGH